MASEEAESRASGIFTEAALKGLTSSAWKERLEAATSIASTVNRMDPADKEGSLELVLCHVMKPTHTDVNVQVVNKLFEIGASMVRASESLSKTVAAVIIPLACAKLPEGKKTVAGVWCLGQGCVCSTSPV